MAQETNQTPGPMLCSTGCGFYGNPRTNGMCSVCYKEHLQRQQNSGRMSPMGKLFPRKNPFEELVDRKHRAKNWGLRLRINAESPRRKTWEKLEIKAASQVLGMTTSGMNDYLQASFSFFIFFFEVLFHSYIHWIWLFNIHFCLDT